MAQAAAPSEDPITHLQTPTTLTAVVRVVADTGGGSQVELTVRLPEQLEQAALPEGWRMCMTWTKTVVLRLPPGAEAQGSFVALPAQPPLQRGASRSFLLTLGAPAMRYVSDLPRSMHVRLPQTDPDAQHETLAIKLEHPGEASIRFDPDLRPPTGPIPRPSSHETFMDSEWFALPPCSCGPLLVEVTTHKALKAGKNLESWAAVWPFGAPLAAAPPDNVAGASEGEPRRAIFAEATEPADLEWFGPEGYELIIAAREIVIVAAEEAGFLRGTASLRQLLSMARSEGRPAVPSVRLRDRPRFGYRGLMLDVSRHFFPADFIKRLLDLMFLFKLNVFHWHLTDDEGWRVEIKALPNLTQRGAWRGAGEAINSQYGGGGERYGGFYTQEQIREIVHYAEERGIAIVPEIDVPGHSFAAIKSLPELLGPAVRKKGDGPRSVQGFFGNVLDPDAPETYTFLEAVFGEVAELFPAPFGIHIGMDEVPAKAWSSEAAEEARLKAKLATWLQAFLAQRGKGLAAWEEAFDGTGLNAMQSPRPTMFSWKEDERPAVHAAAKVYQVVLCPAAFLYLDIVEGLDFEDRGLYWAAQTLPLDRVYNYEPIQRLRSFGLEAEAERNILGVQANLWSETTDTPMLAEAKLFPRLLAAAEVAWTEAERRHLSDFHWRVPPHLAWLERDLSVKSGGLGQGLILSDNFMRVPRAPRLEEEGIP